MCHNFLGQRTMGEKSIAKVVLKKCIPGGKGFTNSEGGCSRETKIPSVKRYHAY